MTDKLKPCPFCGGEAEHEIFEDGFWVWCRVQCTPCGVMLTVPYTTGEEGFNAWNRRADNDR